MSLTVVNPGGDLDTNEAPPHELEFDAMRLRLFLIESRTFAIRLGKTLCERSMRSEREKAIGNDKAKNVLEEQRPENAKAAE